ncbi:hypothetical protein ADK70_03915 [Streptomyces rimosus subsp. pseudoverticillatus]|uniref:DUF6461 domain-containing protein n=1 Tax=Streptomyces rimosus TaxID=1927 RepID=UPI0006B29E88|nr:DUF6461 domain-containing protein [Streptomyces rimosus]KOT99369.1 hypothetical protein ADK70_03915 [Streptomyces rimosus subsp. pseudoverticillatus]
MSDGLQWVAERGAFEMGYWIVFARGLSAEELVSRLEGDFAAMTLMSWSDAVELEMEAEDEDEQVVRVGSCQGWAFAVAEYGPLGERTDELVQAASAGTEAVSVSRTVNADTWFLHAKDGETLCEFEPGLEHERTGVSSNDLVEALKQVGLLLPDGTSPREHGSDVDDSERRVLQMAEQAFGVGLPRDQVEHGQLLGARLSG